MTQLSMFDPQALTIAPSRYPAARQTSALAAVANLPRKATQNYHILNLITAAGETGISDLELHRATGYLRQTICVRRYDLRSQILPADGRYTDPQTLRTYQRWKRVDTVDGVQRIVHADGKVTVVLP